MSIPTCAVHCKFEDQTGDPVVGAKVLAQLSSFEIYAGYVVPERTEGVTDSSGQCTLNLWPNQLGAVESSYTISVNAPGGYRLRVLAVVPNLVSANLHEITTLPPYPGKLDGQASIEAAQEAGNTALAAMHDAQSAASAASASQVAAAASATAAGSSATAAASSATSASGSATAAAGSATAASGSATAASGSATAAAGSATAASGSATAAATSATTAQTAATSAQLAKKSQNRLINGSFEVNQLGISGVVTLAAGQYGHDGWKGGASGCQYAHVVNDGITQITIISGSLVQTMEAKNLKTNTYVLSWQGTAQGRIAAGAYSASGVTVSHTFGANLDVEFRNGSLYLAQFEPGTTPTTFDFREDELRRCQRYCWKTYSQGVAPGTATLVGARGASNVANIAAGACTVLTYPVEMVAEPTITFYNPTTGAAGTWRAGVANYSMGNASIPASTNGAFVANNAAIATVGQVLFGHVLVEARL